MTAYSPAALDQLKKDIAHAAIEWTMKTEPVSWMGDCNQGFWGAGWDGRLPPVSGPTGTVDLALHMPGLGSDYGGYPPGATSHGGGYAHGDTMEPVTKFTIDPWNDIYQPWIQRIDTAFEGWDTLPDPDAFKGLADKVRSAVMELTPNPSDGATADTNGQFQQKFSNGDTTSDLSFLDQYVGPETSKGIMVAHFRLAYGAPRIASVMTNQGQVAIALGVALLAESTMWTKARTDVMNLADKALDCFKGKGYGGGGSINFDVIKAFTGLAEMFVPGPIAKALEVADKGLDLAQAVMPQNTSGDATADISGVKPDDAYNSLLDAIRTLNGRVYDQEYEIASKTLDGMSDNMYSMKPSTFHINPEAGLDPATQADDSGNGKVLQGDLSSYKVVGYEVMPRLAAVMGRAAQDVEGADSSGVWTRSYAIGMGSIGAYDNWSTLQGMFDKVTTGSGKEVVEAGQLLATAAGYQKDTDGSVKKALAGVGSVIDKGSDGWDNHRPTTGVYVGGHYYYF